MAGEKTGWPEVYPDEWCGEWRQNGLVVVRLLMRMIGIGDRNGIDRGSN
jgi:hypothetical protein